MSVAIARHGKLAYMRTYGDQDVEEVGVFPPISFDSDFDLSEEHSAAMTISSLPGQGVRFAPDTIVRLYSMSKPLVSAAAMILYEKGKFQLDDPISKHLPEFKNPREHASQCCHRQNTTKPFLRRVAVVSFDHSVQHLYYATLLSCQCC